MPKYRWIKIKDILGSTYEFEDCEMKKGLFTIIIFFKAPIGIVQKVFSRRNLISFEYLKDDEA